MSPRFGSGMNRDFYVAEAVAAAPGSRTTLRNSPCPSRATGRPHLAAGRLRQARAALSLPDGGAPRQRGDAGDRLQACRPHYRLLRARIQAPRHFDRVHEAPGVTLPRPAGDAEGCAVVRARPHMGEAERHVDRILKVDGFQRREALVVVEGDRDVELALQLAREEGVRGLAAGHPGELRAQQVEDRVDQVALLRPISPPPRRGGFSPADSYPPAGRRPRSGRARRPPSRRARCPHA